LRENLKSALLSDNARERLFTSPQNRRQWRAWYVGLYSAASVLLMLALLGCEAERRKTDAELGLNPTQATGRHIFDRQCGGCHEAYNSRPLKGPSLQGLFKHPYMKNGMPANDERVREIVIYGRAKMPAYGRALTPEQVDIVMGYLHTL
jgi:mono/diheme cytochrome c family protein